ncbi:MAG TPA: T9SS type A sorting domain-containing protein, partial [Cytophagales bacterium]|nr:T9SS type A sorting domain-containing protein [Cytophagales bacterium]
SNSGPKNLLYRLDLQSYVWSIANLPHDFTSLALQFMGNDILISTETEIWISSNEGNTWSKTAIAGFNSTIIRGIIEVAPQTYLAWTPEGIVQSIDTGITWTRSSTGLPLSSNFNSVTYNDGEYLVHGYGSSRNEVLPYLFSNNGSDWRYPTMEERHHVSQPYSVLQNGTKFSLQNDSGKLFLFKSLTGTKVWNKISGQIDGLASLCTQGNILYVEITVGASHDHGVDGFSISSLHRSVDEGQDFEELSASLAPIGAINANISLIGSDSTFIYLEKMTSDTTKQIFRSLASPINWEYIFTASISSTIHLNRNAVYVYDGWVHTLRIYEKDTLKRVPTPANEGRFYTSPYSNTLYYANLAPDTQETSIFQSTDLGNNWTSIADNLPEHIKVNDIDFSKTQIFIATDQGLFQRESNSVVTYVDSEVENLVVKLIQCYPQPASHQLNVALTDKIEVDGAFVVQIRSTTGKVLEEFIEDTKTFMVNVTAYKSGMYFLTIYQKQKKYDVNFLIN